MLEAPIQKPLGIFKALHLDAPAVLGDGVNGVLYTSVRAIKEKCL